MIKVTIMKEGKEGIIEYSEDDRIPKITFPDKNVTEEIKTYLTTEREFRIPESPRIDDYRIDKEVPTKDEMYFSLALCTLWANTEVFVVW